MSDIIDALFTLPSGWPLKWRRAFLLTLPASLPAYALYLALLTFSFLAILFPCFVAIEAYETFWKDDNNA